MSSKFVEKLNSVEWLLTDGATGTNLFDMGLMSGDSPELWNEEFPEKIIKLHKNAVDAGSDLFLTNSFGSNALRLKLHNSGDKAFELSKLSAEIARGVADATISRFLSQDQLAQQVRLCTLLENLPIKQPLKCFMNRLKGSRLGALIFFG